MLLVNCDVKRDILRFDEVPANSIFFFRDSLYTKVNNSKIKIEADVPFLLAFDFNFNRYAVNLKNGSLLNDIDDYTAVWLPTRAVLNIEE